VTGVDRAADGTLYVSELFGGPCTFDRIPQCFPGRVVRVRPDGTRDYLPVPFRSGVGVKGDRVLVNALSTSPVPTGSARASPRCGGLGAAVALRAVEMTAPDPFAEPCLEV
jgi:hypothetical protein